MRGFRRPAAAAAAVVLALRVVGAAPAAAVAGDTTPPVPGETPVAYYDYSGKTQLIDVQVSFTDPESQITLLVSCEGGPVAAYPYAPHIFVPAIDADAGGCPAYGSHVLQVEAASDGGHTLGYITSVLTWPSFELQFPLPAETGRPFTVHPVFSGGWTPDPGAVCRWELRWGSVTSLRDNNFDETFGGMLFEGKASDGYCGDWTFTLPWVSEPRFEFSLQVPGALNVRSSQWPDRDLVMARVVGTDRQIRESTLAMVQVLPSTSSPIVGQPVTYTRYFLGGAGASSADRPRWMARLGSGETPLVWEMITTSATFTFTPPRPGALFVGWDRASSPYLLGGYYDPPVRYRDLTRPNTTIPMETLGGARLASGVPVTIRWAGSDTGWGIQRYQLQRRVDAGRWGWVALLSLRTTSIVQQLPPGHAYRFRVRAVDKAGNVGAWVYGATFRPRVVQETNPSITYGRPWMQIPDPTASGGGLRETTAGGATVRYRFAGRGVAWLAERGPGRGLVDVYLDGVKVATVDLASPADSPRLVVFRRRFAAVGIHTLLLRNRATAGRPGANLDAILVLR